MPVYKYARYLRNKQLGVQFYRQRPIKNRYIADFYCSRGKLIIEVDGLYHDFTIEQDEFRDAYLEAQGFFILRFSNNQVLEDIEKVLRDNKGAYLTSLC